jgi:hypothetical protein
LSKRDTIELKFHDFVKVLGIVGGMAFIMVSFAYGITYIFKDGSIRFPIELYYILFLFSIGFVLFSVYFEREMSTVYPRELIGGAVASACMTFLIVATIGGILYIYEEGLYGPDNDTIIYAFSIAIILSLISYFVIRRVEFKIELNHFMKVLAIVIGIALVLMISTIYGINYILRIDMCPIPPYLLFFVFAIGFVIFSVFLEKKERGVYPYFLLGGAILSIISTFLIDATIGGIKYIFEEGPTCLGTDIVFYSLSICIILSTILFNTYNQLKDKL